MNTFEGVNSVSQAATYCGSIATLFGIVFRFRGDIVLGETKQHIFVNYRVREVHTYMYSPLGIRIIIFFNVTFNIST